MQQDTIRTIHHLMPGTNVSGGWEGIYACDVAKVNEAVAGVEGNTQDEYQQNLIDALQGVISDACVEVKDWKMHKDQWSVFISARPGSPGIHFVVNA